MICWFPTCFLFEGKGVIAKEWNTPQWINSILNQIFNIGEKGWFSEQKLDDSSMARKKGDGDEKIIQNRIWWWCWWWWCWWWWWWWWWWWRRRRRWWWWTIYSLRVASIALINQIPRCVKRQRTVCGLVQSAGVELPKLLKGLAETLSPHS